MPAKLVVLGIDAATPLMLRMAAEGRLPAIRSLIDRGVRGSVRSVEGLFVGSTWPSFYTGLHPGHHGFYRIDQLSSGSYDFFEPLRTEDGLGGVPFWRHASDEGRRVAVLDVPLTRIENDLNGIQVVEWGAHDAAVGFGAWPPALAQEVLDTVGEHPHPSTCVSVRSTPAEFRAFADALEQGVRKKVELTLDLLDREEWDLFVQVFTEVHCAGHHCWHIHDPAHPAHDPELRREVGDPVERLLLEVDEAVGAIVDRAPDATFLLISNHGMRHFHGASFVLPEILFRLGVAARRPRPPRSMGDLAKGVARRVWRTLPDGLRASLRSTRERLGPQARPGSRVWVDVSRSKCFSIPNGFPVAGIRLNLKGREPQGVLDGNDEVEAFCSELTKDLLEITDCRSGRPLVQQVIRTDDLYPGPYRDALPDLLVEWASDVPTGSQVHAGGRAARVACTSPKIGRVEGTNRYMRTGGHDLGGAFVLVDSRWAPGEVEDPVSVLDFYPTICRILDVSIPEVDGTPLPVRAEV